MKMKLIVSLLALCLTLSVASVQAQTDTAGNMDNMNVIMTGNMAETINCNMTGNAAMIGNIDNTTGKMDNMTGMAGKMNNMTGKIDNMTRFMAFNVTGKIVIIRDMGQYDRKSGYDWKNR